MWRHIKGGAESCLRIAARQMKYVFLHADFWIVIAAMGAYYLTCLQGTSAYLEACGEGLGVFAVFPAMMRERDNLFLALAGYLFLVSDIPDFYPGVDMQVLRISRTVWYFSQWVYLLFLTAVYFLLLAAEQILILIPCLEFTSGWGTAITGGGFTDDRLYYSADMSILQQGAVAEFFAFFALMVLLALFLAGVCIACNMTFRYAGMGVLAGTLMIFAYLLYETGEFSLGIWSPVETFARSEAAGAAGYAGYVCYYIFLCTLLFALGAHRLSKTDITERAVL